MLRAPAVARKGHTGMEAADLPGPQRAGFAKGKWIWGTELPKAGKGHSHTEKPAMLEPKSVGTTAQC